MLYMELENLWTCQKLGQYHTKGTQDETELNWNAVEK